MKGPVLLTKYTGIRAFIPSFIGSWVLVVITLMMQSSSHANDEYQVLRQSSNGFAKVIPGRQFLFPDDHGMHPDYRIEWWYITANLTDAAGQHWGIQWTLFRQSMDAKPVLRGWESNQLWMAHAAISTPGGHHYAERFARGGIGQAGVKAARRTDLTIQPFEAWLDDWSWLAQTASPFPSELRFSAKDVTVRLSMQSNTPWVLQGERGFSQKSGSGQASYYYSQPHIQVSGVITQESIDHVVSGHAWLDREWSSQPLAEEQQGWDWFSLHLDNGHALMVYRLRQSNQQHWLSGSWIGSKGKSQFLKPGEIIIRELEYRKILVDDGQTTNTPTVSVTLPLSWEIAIPHLGQRWKVDSLYDQQWMGTRFPYWEGVVKVDGGKSGMGYMELTGYPVKSN